SGGRSPYAVGFTKVDRSAEFVGVGLLFAGLILGAVLCVIGAAFLPVGLVQMYRSKRSSPA
ncbi:MAG: hypothetical protein ACKOYM_00025, partial [Actinomycetes bacterium]